MRHGKEGVMRDVVGSCQHRRCRRDGDLGAERGCPVLMRPDLNVAETIRFAGALEGVIGKADGLSGVAVISD